MPRKSTREEFIDKANIVHSNKYDYSKVEYINSLTKVCIICPKHGEFWQTPANHLFGKGCLKCSHIKVNKSNTKDNFYFIIKANQTHHNRYDYSKIVYINAITKVCIICPDHGEFWQTPNKHLTGRGCPKCRQSKGELLIEQWLKKHNIKFVPQKRFKDCLNKNPLPFDFYLPEINTCIEYDGALHFIPSRRFGGKIKLQTTQFNDKIKNNYCQKKGIQLLRINYKEKLFDKLSSYFKLF